VDSKRKEEKKPAPISLTDFVDVLAGQSDRDKDELSKTVELGSPVIQKKIQKRSIAPMKSEYSNDSPKDD